MSDKVSDERLREYAASFNNPDVRALAAELLALRAQQQAAGWRVKPLEWDADGFALTPFGAYTVTDAEGGADGYQWTFHCYPYGTADEVVHPSIGAAKAAAQSDYAARINSAIEPAPVAAHVSRLTEALEKISRMHTVPDDKTNTFTLAMAHVVAAKALNHTDGDA